MLMNNTIMYLKACSRGGALNLSEDSTKGTKRMLCTQMNGNYNQIVVTLKKNTAPNSNR